MCAVDFINRSFINHIKGMSHYFGQNIGYFCLKGLNIEADNNWVKISAGLILGSLHRGRLIHCFIHNYHFYDNLLGS